MSRVVKCPRCGIVKNDKSLVNCDTCGSPIFKILLGGAWYSTDDLDASNPFNCNNSEFLDDLLMEENEQG